MTFDCRTDQPGYHNDESLNPSSSNHIDYADYHMALDFMRFTEMFEHLDDEDLANLGQAIHEGNWDLVADYKDRFNRITKSWYDEACENDSKEVRLTD